MVRTTLMVVSKVRIKLMAICRISVTARLMVKCMVWFESSFDSIDIICLHAFVRGEEGRRPSPRGISSNYYNPHAHTRELTT